jgi:hypothetical protein
MSDCKHEHAAIIASKARIESGRGEVHGDIRWCPDCGAWRGELNAHEAREHNRVSPWLRVGAQSVVAAAAKAAADEARRESVYAVG